MKKIVLSLLCLPFFGCAQESRDTVLTVEPEPIKTTSNGLPMEQQVFIEPNYVYDEGIAYDEEGESLNLKEAFANIQIQDDVMYLTVFYNPSSIFKKKAVEEYEIATAFYYTDDGVVTAKGNRLSAEYDEEGNPQVKRESYKFMFFMEQQALVIESLVNDQIKFILTGQQLPQEEDLQDLIQQQEKVQSRN